jgi:hypothetical protein
MERDPLGDQYVDGRTLKTESKAVRSDDMHWVQLVQGRGQWWVLVGAVTNRRFS